MRKPIPPLGFVPVDSEEAKGIPDETLVFLARIVEGKWLVGTYTMGVARSCNIQRGYRHYHVQLPPAVEWEEVWTLDTKEHPIQPTPIIRKNGKHVCSLSAFNVEERNTIVRALNEMEWRDG